MTVFLTIVFIVLYLWMGLGIAVCVDEMNPKISVLLFWPIYLFIHGVILLYNLTAIMIEAFIRRGK